MRWSSWERIILGVTNLQTIFASFFSSYDLAISSFLFSLAVLHRIQPEEVVILGDNHTGSDQHTNNIRLFVSPFFFAPPLDMTFAVDWALRNNDLSISSFFWFRSAAQDPA